MRGVGTAWADTKYGDTSAEGLETLDRGRVASGVGAGRAGGAGESLAPETQ